MCRQMVSVFVCVQCVPCNDLLPLHLDVRPHAANDEGAVVLLREILIYIFSRKRQSMNASKFAENR